MKYFSLLLFVSLFTNCYQIERNCKDYKTGSYTSTITIDSVDYVSTFKRFASVRWINDCEMIFRTINPKNMAERKDVHLKILTTTDSSYTFEYSYVGKTNKQKGIAIKIK